MALTTILAGSPLSAAEPDAAALVSALARPAPARTPYTEVRFASMLDRPLILHGELEYLGPGKLGKRVDTPYQEATTIDGSDVAIKRGSGDVRHYSLNQAPEMEGFLRGFSALLGGDAKTLAADFELKTGGDAKAVWTLNLIPRDARLRRRIMAIDVYGSGTTPRCFATSEADGDTNILLVDDLASAKLPTRFAPTIVINLCRSEKSAQ